MIKALREQGIQDIDAHLYESGRCAIAHANKQPIVDPDKPEDLRRLSFEAPLIRALAQKAIEEELGVETRNTVYRKHLFELAGFKDILGTELCEMLARGEQNTVDRMVNIPEINVELFDKPPYEPLRSLCPRELQQDGSKLFIVFGSADDTVLFRLCLDFAAERLVFSMFTDLGVTDTGSAASARRVREVRRFAQELFGNGRLRIIEAETGRLISWKSAYIPLNMYQNTNGCKRELAYWDRVAAERQERESRYAAQLERFTRGYAIIVCSKV